MLVVQRFRQSTHARDRDFGFLQQGDPLFTGEAPKARLNDVLQLAATLVVRALASKPGLGRGPIRM